MPSAGDNIRVVLNGTTGTGTAPFDVSWVWTVTAIEAGRSLNSWMQLMETLLSNQWYRQGNRLDLDYLIGFSTHQLTAVNLNTPTEEAVVGAGWNGNGSGGTVMAPQATAVIALSTGLRGRSYNGRIFWPVNDSRDFEGGVIHQNTRNRLQAFFGLMRQVGNTQNIATLGVWSRRLSTENAPFVTPVTAVSVRPTLYWQRRRRVG